MDDGDCIASAGIQEQIDSGNVVVIPCTENWEFKVLGSFEVPDADEYPGDDYFTAQAIDRCSPRFAFTFYPTSVTWENGDRAVYCLQRAYGLAVIDPAKIDRYLNTYSLDDNQCFNAAPETGHEMVEQVDCNSAWDYRILDAFDVPDADEYPGDLYFGRQAYATCGAQAYDWLLPDENTWPVGDRTIICMQASFSLHETDPSKIDRLYDVNFLSAGQCFRHAPETNNVLVEVVGCDGQYDELITHIFDVPDAEIFPEETYFQEQVEQVCGAQALETYRRPVITTWVVGHRTVICTIPG